MSGRAVSTKKAISVSIMIGALGGDLAVRLPPAVLRCAGYSQTVRLLPRDSIREFEVQVVGSEAGNYTLAVQHLLDPEHLVTAEVTVRD